jgi:hypothetical protein
VNVYQYSERYLIAFEDEDFGEMILHPPPVNLLTLAFLPLALIRPLAVHLNKFFSYLIFWLENVVFLALYLLYELCLLPLVYFKVFFNLLFSPKGLFTVIFYCLVWLFFGIALTFVMVLQDIWCLLTILAMHQGCRSAMALSDELEQVRVDSRLKLKVYNEVRQTVIELYIEIRK